VAGNKGCKRVSETSRRSLSVIGTLAEALMYMERTLSLSAIQVLALPRRRHTVLELELPTQTKQRLAS
jgi:hypothetical protein